MKKSILSVAAICAFTTLAQEVPVPASRPMTPATPTMSPAAAAKRADKGPKAPTYDEKADAAADIKAALARAKKNNKRVLVQWGANWCGWCVVLADTMKSDGKISREMLYEYELVKVDMGRFDKHLDVAKAYGAEFKAIPYLTILDADGKPIVQQNTEPLELKAEANAKPKLGHDTAKVLEFLKTHEAKPWVAADLEKAALDKAKAEGKQVFLHFGAPWCGWCHRLEDWMARPEINAILSKEFVDLKIDTDRMTGAADLVTRWRGSEKGGIPWFCFIAADGTKGPVSESDKGQNIGFPAQPDEVALFRAMLTKSCKILSAEEIKTLGDSLEAPKTAAGR